MAQNEFDQASRYAAKLDPAGFLSWLLRLPLEAFLFRGWLDTRTLPFPGERDRIRDTVAHLEDLAMNGMPWALPVEFQIEPDADMFGRLLQYLGSLWLEKRPDPEAGSRFCVGAVVVNLTGQGNSSRDYHWSAAGVRCHLGVCERNLADLSAAETLADIESGKTARCVLPWIRLLQGGDDSGIIQRWAELASAESDARRRSDYGGLALVFAEAAKRQEAWKLALKEWNMIRSQQVAEWKNEARVEAKIEDLLEVLRTRCGAVPEDLAATVRGTTDLGLLTRWLILAAQADSLEAFRQQAQI
jgi:hypothetical protein